MTKRELENYRHKEAIMTKAGRKNGKEAQPAKADPKLVAKAKALKKEYGPMTAVHAIVQRNKALTRGQFLAVAKAAGINPNTASNEFHRVRSGGVALQNLAEVI